MLLIEKIYNFLQVLRIFPSKKGISHKGEKGYTIIDIINITSIIVYAKTPYYTTYPYIKFDVP